MRIVLVIDQYDSGNNGTTVTAQRYAAELRKRGHTVIALACGEPAENKVAVPEWRLPVFDGLVASQGMRFAKPVDAAYYEAFQGADIIHFFLPFRFCRRGEEIARQMRIPTIAAFHLQPENITYTIGLGKCKALNDFLYQRGYQAFYNRFTHIHCPSEFIAEQLKQHGYDAKLHVISNGVDDAFVMHKTPRPPEFDGKFIVLMIGRLSGEKRQDLVMKAAIRSRYRDKIQLIFAGKGPKLKKYQKLGKKLPHPPLFGFYNQDDLISLINCCDIYVHASDAEIEGISCMEAFSCGLVPVISDSALSATGQYALDKHSLFQAGNAQSLADRIDYWIENPDKREKMAAAYAGKGDMIRVGSCVKQAEIMYEEAIKDFRAHGYKQPQPGRLRKMLYPNINKANFQYCPNSIGRRIWLSVLTNGLTPLLYLIDSVWFGLEIEGRAHLRGICGGVSVMNHVHPMDCTMAKIAAFPNRMYFISLRRNLELPFVGWLVRWFGGVPIPEMPSDMMVFQRQMEEAIGQGDVMHFYPEGQLILYYENLREFHRGAFLTAVRTGCPVIPMVLTYRKSGFFRSLIRKKPRICLSICEPQYADASLSRGAAVEELMKRTKRVMEEHIQGPSLHTGTQTVKSEDTRELVNQ